MQLKSEEKHLQREAALKQVDEQAEQIKSLTSDLQAKSKEMQDSQMLILDLKSQIIERDGNIRDLLDKVAQKGEETAELSSRLLELKNYLMDQQMFEMKYSVTRVPVSSIIWSPNLKAVMNDKEQKQKKSNKGEIERKELVLSFVQDKQRYGEYFLQIETPTEETQKEDSGELFKSKPKAAGAEKKMIPALDIKSLETVDALTFSIILHDDCLLNCYDVVEQEKSTKAKRTTSLFNLGNLMNLNSSQKDDGGFPMAFESEHVTQIIQFYQKLHSLAYTRQQDLNSKWEESQKQLEKDDQTADTPQSAASNNTEEKIKHSSLLNNFQDKFFKK